MRTDLRGTKLDGARLERTDFEGAVTGGQRSEPEAQSDTWQFQLGHEYAPDSPWGLDLLVVSSGQRFRYENRRAGHVLRIRTGKLAPELHGRLLGWLRESGFPRVAEHRKPPGASYVTIDHTTGAGTQSVHLELAAAERMPGYGPLVAALDVWVAHLRAAEGALPAGFSEDDPDSLA